MAKKFSNRWGRTAEENFRTEEVERLNGCVICTIQFSGFASFPAPTELSGKMETSSHGDTSYSHATPQFCLRTEKKKICGTREPEQTGLGTVINQSIQCGNYRRINCNGTWNFDTKKAMQDRDSTDGLLSKCRVDHKSNPIYCFHFTSGVQSVKVNHWI